MIEIKNRKIHELEIGEKFLHNGSRCEKTKDSFRIDSCKNMDNAAVPLPTYFHQIERCGLFIFENTLWLRDGNRDMAIHLETARNQNFNPEREVLRVNKLVAML